MEPMPKMRVTAKVAAITRDGAVVEQWARLEIVGAIGAINGIPKLGYGRFSNWVFCLVFGSCSTTSTSTKKTNMYIHISCF